MYSEIYNTNCKHILLYSPYNKNTEKRKKDLLGVGDGEIKEGSSFSPQCVAFLQGTHMIFIFYILYFLIYFLFILIKNGI